MDVKVRNSGTKNSGSILTSDLSGAESESKVSSAKSGSSGAVSAVGVSVSDKAKETAAARQKAFDIAKNTDPVRHDRVAELKAQIAAGTYQADPEKIAHGMLREAIKDRVSSQES
jgi:flagellar biosynthesis anti-sigma factor FlgM